MKIGNKVVERKHSTWWKREVEKENMYKRSRNV
jgi:hypothetical protein